MEKVLVSSPHFHYESGYYKHRVQFPDCPCLFAVSVFLGCERVGDVWLCAGGFFAGRKCLLDERIT